MKIIDERINQDGNTEQLIKVQNDLCDTVFMLIVEPNGCETEYCLTDWWGATPETLDEAAEYDWVLLEQAHDWQ